MTAEEVNSSSPVVTAKANAPQVNGSTCAPTLLTRLSVEAMPRMRRSTMAMVPTTSTMASTWTLSIHGNSEPFERMALAKGSCSRPAQSGSRVMRAYSWV